MLEFNIALPSETAKHEVHRMIHAQCPSGGSENDSSPNRELQAPSRAGNGWMEWELDCCRWINI